jgi:MFS transporter, putative metabolite:H+ symporter
MCCWRSVSAKTSKAAPLPIESIHAAGSIAARLDRLPATRSIWRLVALLSLGGFFEFYDLFFTGYIAPGLVRSGILTSSTRGLFGTTGVASFVAALFLGLFVGTALFGFVADRFGRRTIFTFSLLWYSAASVVMAFQSDVFGLNLWRFLSGIGVGVELVTIDAYLSELVPKELRGRAFALNQTIQFSAVPLVALLAWLLVPRSPLGLDGWRWVVLIGAAGAVLVWRIRRDVPESPRWLAQQGKIGEAQAIVTNLEARVAMESGLALAQPAQAETPAPRGSFAEIWKPPYRRRTVMLIVFNVFQIVGYYGFSSWVPTFLIRRGISVVNSLEYTFLIAIAAPLGPLLAYRLADRFERKWQIVAAASAVGAFGLLFGQMTLAPLLIALGILLTMSNNILSFSFHAYQAELYPTRIRALAIGFVYSWSRLSGVFSAFAIAFFLDRFGVPGVFTFIAGSMAMVVLSIAFLGPRTSRLALEAISK